VGTGVSPVQAEQSSAAIRGRARLQPRHNDN